MSVSPLAKLARNVKRAFRAPIDNYGAYQARLRGKEGIEIGGPSKIFRRDLPIYKVIRSLDGVNFSGQTVWEGALTEGQTFQYGKGRTGRQFIGEGTELKAIDDGRYDFLISCNNLEHIANPLAALTEWRRVVKPNGHILLILPRKESNFDHRRSVTSFEHLLEDLHNAVDEHDLTHLDEILALHDRSLDTASGDLETFKARSLKNFDNRCLHHHVFDMPLIERIFDHFGMPVVLKNTIQSDYIALGQRV